MKGICLSLVAVLLTGTYASAQSSPYYIETVEVTPKGTRAQQDEDLGALYSGPQEKTSSLKETTAGDGSSYMPRSSSRGVFEVYGYQSIYEMRSRRRFGVGLATSGQMGLMGALVEYNATPENSLVLGAGGGPHYSSFSAQWKHLFSGQHFAPYSSLGFARWYNASGQSGSVVKTNPSPLASKFLSENEKQSGKFSVELFTPSLGLQYSPLAGSYIGASLFAEIVMLVEIESLQQAPVGSLGMLYYF